MGAAILDLTSWGPPSWTGSDVKNSIVAPILLQITSRQMFDDVTLCKHVTTEAENAFIVFNSFPLIREINK